MIGSYRGFELSLRFDTFRSEYQALLKGQRKYTVPLGTDPLGNIIRLDNSLNNFPERITAAENELDTLHQGGNAMRLKDNTNPFIHVNPPYQLMVIHSSKLVYLHVQESIRQSAIQLFSEAFSA